MKPFAIGTIVGAAIVFLCMRSCKMDVQEVNHAAIDSLNTVVHSRDSTYSADSAVWVANAHAQDAIITSLTQSKEEQYDALKNRIVMLTFQRDKYRTSAEAKDTVGQLQSCAEFMQLADSFYTKAVTYEATLDSLISVDSFRQTSDATTIRQLMVEREAVRQERDAYKKFMEDAIKDNNDLRKALAKSKRGRWIMLVAGIIGGSIITHEIK